MTEAQLTAPIEAAAKARGWRVSHDPDSRGQERGEPDLHFSWPLEAGPCPGRCTEFEAECKRADRGLTHEQRRYMNSRNMDRRPVMYWLLPDDYDQAEGALGLVPGVLGRYPATPHPERTGKSRGGKAAPAEQGLKQRIAALPAERKEVYDAALESGYIIADALRLAERARVPAGRG